MLSPALSDLLKPAKTTITLIWFAMVVSAIIYVVIAQMVQQRGLIEVSFEVNQPLLYLAVIVSIVAGATSLWVGRYVFSAKLVQQMYRNKPSLKTLATPPNRQEAHPATLEVLKELPYDEAFLFSLKTPYMNAMMARLIPAELIAIIGLLLALLTADFRLATAFVVPAVLLMVLAFPRLDAALVKARGWLQG